MRARDQQWLVRRRAGAKKASALRLLTGAHPGAEAPWARTQVDSTRCDIRLVREGNRAVIGRATVTLALDLYSRVIAGFSALLEAPSTITVATCLAHACLPAERGLARPARAARRSLAGVGQARRARVRSGAGERGPRHPARPQAARHHAQGPAEGPSGAARPRRAGDRHDDARRPQVARHHVQQRQRAWRGRAGQARVPDAARAGAGASARHRQLQPHRPRGRRRAPDGPLPRLFPQAQPARWRAHPAPAAGEPLAARSAAVRDQGPGARRRAPVPGGLQLARPAAAVAARQRPLRAAHRGLRPEEPRAGVGRGRDDGRVPPACALPGSSPGHDAG